MIESMDEAGFASTVLTFQQRERIFAGIIHRLVELGEIDAEYGTIASELDLPTNVDNRRQFVCEPSTAKRK